MGLVVYIAFCYIELNFQLEHMEFSVLSVVQIYVHIELVLICVFSVLISVIIFLWVYSLRYVDEDNVKQKESSKYRM